MSKRLPQVLVALVALFGVLAVVIVLRPADSGGGDPGAQDGSGSGGGPGATIEIPELSPEEKATRAADAFLDRYVGADGRVERQPEGDTVSEGQAYAMLLAVATDDRERFALVWNWTRTNLLGADGTLAWRWADGVIVDPNAATDADVDAGRALLLAAEEFSVPAYRADAVALAEALMEHDVVDTAGGPVLVAGPWAIESPHFVNPSYLSDVAFEMFADATGDQRWIEVAATSTDLLVELTDDGRSLPPDWATVLSDGTASASPAPGGDQVAYGYEAFRTLPRLAEACDDENRDLATSLGDVVERTISEPASTSNLDGSPLATGDNPLFLLAAASASAEDDARAADLLDDAEQVHLEQPSYYLGAWVALSRVILATDDLGGCATQDVPDTTVTTVGAAASTSQP